jgi:hypothetical protein
VAFLFFNIKQQTIPLDGEMSHGFYHCIYQRVLDDHHSTSKHSSLYALSPSNFSEYDGGKIQKIKVVAGGMNAREYFYS